MYVRPISTLLSLGKSTPEIRAIYSCTSIFDAAATLTAIEKAFTKRASIVV
jgi:hypothetical protein